MTPEDVALEDPHSTVQLRRRRLLVVDDSRMQRRILAAFLKRWNYEILEAGTGAEAIEIASTTPVDFVLSAWMLSEMSGLDLCEAFRALDRDSYGYFVLLTSKSEKEDVAKGLDSGADDFLTKPVNGAELKARLMAGERILRMQEQLVEKNRLISQTLDKISALYDSINSDLQQARHLQASLVPDRVKHYPGADLSFLLRPSGHVGGDLVGHFRIGQGRVGIFAIDVSGHGIASAMMAARLAGFLSSSTPEQNVALYETSDGEFEAHSPAIVATRLNELTLKAIETENYFTLAYADVDLATGHAKLVQAGHPHPMIHRSDGSVECIGGGGPPVGLLEDMVYPEFEAQLRPGDKLFLLSDGFTECPNKDGELLDEDGFERLLHRNQSAHGSALLETLLWDLAAFAGDEDFPDDISTVLLEFHGPSKTADDRP